MQKRKSFYFISIILFLVGFLFSCKKEPEVNPVPRNDKKITRTDRTIDLEYQFYEPKNSADTIIWENFEGQNITSNNPWVYQNAELTSIAKVRNDLIEKNNNNKQYYESLFNGIDTNLVSLSANGRITSTLTYSNLNLSQDGYLTFKYFFVGYTDSTFKIYINENQEIFSVAGVNNSSCFTISTKNIKIPAGTKSITFWVNNSTGKSFSNWPNAAFIDDISLVYDKVTSIIVTPRSSQKTYKNCPENEKLLIKAYPLRADGTIVKDKTVTLSSSNGTIDSKGYFTPTKAGTSKIVATCSGVTGESGQITIASDAFCEGSCVIGGVTYSGIKSDNGDSLTKQDPKWSNCNVKVNFEYPSTNKVSVDGFLRLKGTLIPSTIDYKNYDKLYISISDGKNTTVKFYDKDFDVRIWIPYGGENTIHIGPAKVDYKSYIDENGKTCEGDLMSWSYLSVYEIKATDTHSHTVSISGETDGRYLYSSYYCQSDNYLVQNATNEALYGLDSATVEEKFAAIHDYIALKLCYDYSSVSGGSGRKKQDAVSVLKNKTGVCEGYSNLTAAMARYAGIPTRVVSSQEKNHAWNHVYINNQWLFCDTTWDDPDKSPDSTYIRYTYYLLTDFNGVNNDHLADDRIIESRSAVGEELSILLKEGYTF